MKVEIIDLEKEGEQIKVTLMCTPPPLEEYVSLGVLGILERMSLTELCAIEEKMDEAVDKQNAKRRKFISEMHKLHIGDATLTEGYSEVEE